MILDEKVLFQGSGHDHIPVCRNFSPPFTKEIKKHVITIEIKSDFVSAVSLGFCKPRV